MHELFAVGVNHHTATIDLREEFHLSQEEILRELAQLRQRHLKEGFLISTCHRTELFGIPATEEISTQSLREYFLHLRPHLRVRNEHVFEMKPPEAIHHLFEIVAGIDSLVLGDVQILAQVKDAFELAMKAGSVGNVTHHLLESALHVGKRVRNETTLGIGAISISYAAVELARKIFDDLQKKKVLLIGLGETGTLTARHLLDRGVEKMFFTNRTRARAEEIAKTFHATVIEFADFPAAIAEMDIIISATSAEHHILTTEMVKQAMKKRLNRPLLIVDIAAPRDVDPNVNKLSNVFLNDIDALQTIVDQNVEKRREEIPKIRKIIDEEFTHFSLWYNSLEATPTILQMRDKFEAVRQSEFQKFRNKFDEHTLETVELLTKRIINKLLHPTMVKLREHASMEDHLEEKVQILRDLFELEAKNQTETTNDEDT